MNRFAVLLCLLCALTLNAQTAHFSYLTNSVSPDKSLALSLSTNNQQKIGGLQLVSLKGNSVIANFQLSSNVLMWRAQQVVVSSILWTDNSTAVAFMIGDGRNGEVYACARLTNGVFHAVNLTGLAKGAHLGVLGRKATDFTRSEHLPVKWGEWTAQYGRVIIIKSHFWDNRDKRFTVSGPFMIGNNGTIGGQ